MIRKYLLLLLILLLAAFLRLIYLGSTPSGFSPDEASQGYTAYSLLKTGRDEWGISFPLGSFRSFLDYKAPLQTYFMIPTIALFGLNEFAVRLPSAIFGILAIAVIYFLARELWPKHKNIGLIAALFLTLSPWHIQFSRTALEVNLSSFLFPLGLLFFLKGKKDTRLYYLAALVWGLNLYSYHAAKFFEPIFIFFLLLFYRRDLTHLPREKIAKLIILAGIIILLLALDSLFGGGGVRASDLLITKISREGVARVSDLQYYSPLREIHPLLPRIFANKLTYIIEQFTGNYLSYLSPAFWFSESGREITYSVLPGTGLLYLFLFPLIVYGFYRLIKDKDSRLFIFCLWLFAGILPAALTKEGYRPNRAGSLLVFWELLAAYGFVLLYESSKNFRRFLLPLALVSSVMVVSYVNTYFFEYETRFPDALSYGHRELFTKLAKYDQPVIVDKGSNSQSFLAFYQKIDPQKFQQASALWWADIKVVRPLYLDMLEGYRLGNYTFKTFNPGTDLVPGNLVVIPAGKYNDQYAPFVKETVFYPTGRPAFYALQKPDEK